MHTPLRSLSLSFKPKELNKLALIKADNHVIPDEDYRHSHLTAFINHLLSLLHIGRNVVLSVGNIVLLKKLFAHLAKMAGWGCVNGDGLLIHDVVL